MDTRGIEYRPVNLERREIRLLEIQNGINIHDPLVCRLATYKVHPDLEFVGLSTLWRDQDDNHTEPIWVNSRRVVVPATIGQALRNVRALFLADQEYLYQTASNTSQSRANSVKSSSSSSPNGTNGHSYHPQSKDTAVARPKKTPGWLKHLLRGFKSILPDDTSPGAVRKAPLRVWVDCLCMDLKNDRETALRRSHVALAYGSAKITVGWLGLKDDTTDIAIGILRRLDSLCPTGFGDPEDRLLHPENYSPVMKWLAPIGDEWNADAKSGGAREQGAMYTAATKFLSRPFFHRQWIVEELTLSKFPAFLMGDEIISWMQLLNWNRMNEEFEKSGCQYFDQETNDLLKNMAKLDLGMVHTFLDDFDRRRDKNDTRGLLLSKTSSSISRSSSQSRTSPAGVRPTTSRTVRSSRSMH